MGKNINKLSLASYGLKYKLRISFYLMSVLPLLVCVYLVANHILPGAGFKVDITLSIFISAIIACIGFFVVKQVFDRVVAIAIEAKLIASGDLGRELKSDARESDEVGDLSESLNQLTQRIRSNMDELKSYSEKTTEINIEIQKRVIILSILLQISSLISQGAKLDEILRLITDKSRLLANSDIGYLLYREEGQEIFTMKSAEGANASYLLKVSVGPKEEPFHKLILSGRTLIVDKDNVLPPEAASAFRDKFKLNNTLVLPVILRGRAIGLLGIGNTRETFLYKKDDSDLLDIFSKQVAIAVENDILMHHVEKLEIKDALTGLYNEGFIRNRLQEEIKRAITYQRPCAFIYIDADDFKKFQQSFGSLHAESALKKIAFLIRESITEIDRAGRIGDDEFGVLLPEKNKRQAQEIAENIRKKIEFNYSEEQDPGRKITVSAGVSENPLDGVDAQELIDKAKELGQAAKKQGKNRVVSFKEPPVYL
ncbi:MAG: hypothetical protein A3G38_04600 [Omnitrophica WOR_2 bacterium RIFCSPLOWO2_12_FULL_51_8]|nr:MAG: hypothetical protein A3G38_04600 [Omnitrophica WOR_2 bacterium RIFCSPLOWO2_12_FULL_51_8]